MNKKSLRKIALEKRQLVKSAILDEEIGRNLFANISIPENSIIAFYMPIKSEVDVRNLVAQYAKNNHTLCLPLIDKEQQNFAFLEYQIGDELHANSYGIPEPLPSAKQVEPNVVILPLVAFDRAKNRLGYGGGYYDRYLQNRDVLKIGVAYSAQELAQIPAEKHDIKLDKIVTEDFIL